MDFISIALGIFSILQNFDKKKTAEEKLDDIKELLTKIDNFYDLLNTAKDIHDTFEVFGHTYIEPLSTSISRLDNTTIGEINDHLSSFFSYYDQHVTLPKLNKNIISPQDTSNVDMPTIVERELEKIWLIYPDLVRAIENFETHANELKEIEKERRYGSDDLKNTVTLIDNSSKEALVKADKIILHTGKVLSYIHHDMKTKIVGM